MTLPPLSPLHRRALRGLHRRAIRLRLQALHRVDQGLGAPEHFASAARRTAGHKWA